MSTRANIIMVEGGERLYFYRHCDGYPDGARPVLDKFMTLVKDGKIRNCLLQGSPWLIILGALEYAESRKLDLTVGFADLEPKDWKAGSMEITTALHGDIEWLYILDLESKTVHQYPADLIPAEYAD